MCSTKFTNDNKVYDNLHYKLYVQNSFSKNSLVDFNQTLLSKANLGCN